MPECYIIAKLLYNTLKGHVESQTKSGSRPAGVYNLSDDITGADPVQGMMGDGVRSVYGEQTQQVLPSSVFGSSVPVTR